MYAPYYSIKHKPWLKSESPVWRHKQILWIHDLDLKLINTIAFICSEDNTIADFVAFNGPLYNAAVDAGL
jgi:hypothetical protein